MDDAVLLSALAIVASLAGALVWLLKKQFTQNDTTIKESTKVIGRLSDVMEIFSKGLKEDEESNKEFQLKVITVLEKISDKQDSIECTVSDTNKLVKG